MVSLYGFSGQLRGCPQRDYAVTENPELHERIMAGRLLAVSAAQISSHLDSFCSWLLLGVGGGYALVLANLASLQGFIAPQSLQTSLFLLLVAIAFGVLQRWLAAIVAASTASGEKAEEIGKELADRDIDVDFRIVFREMERGTYYPAKWMVRRSFNKAMSGDFAAGGRITALISQIQSALAFVVVGLVVAAIAVTAYGVKV